MGFFGEVFQEMKKVTWPSGKELASSSGTVFSTIAIFAVFFFAVDWVIQKVLGFIINFGK